MTDLILEEKVRRKKEDENKAQTNKKLKNLKNSRSQASAKNIKDSAYCIYQLFPYSL